MRKLIGTMLVIILAVVAGTYTYTRSVEAGRPVPILLKQPAGWVAFDADVYQTQDDAPDSYGRIYRSSNGSVRVDMKSHDEWLLNVTVITNTKTGSRMQHIRRPGDPNPHLNKWELRFADHLLHPKPPGFATTTVGLTPSEEMVEGYSTYKLAGNKDTLDYALLAPDLNFFEVVSYSHASGGILRKLSNIVERDQDPTLFMPDEAR